MSDDQYSVSRSIGRLWRHLPKHRKWQCLALLVLMLLSAIAEVISLGAVLPFLGVLAAPERVLSYPLVQNHAPYFGISRPEQLLLPVTAFFVMAALASGAVRLLQIWASTRFAYAVGHDLSVEVYRRTLYQPYMVHLSRNSSEIISGVEKVNSAITVLSNLLIMCGSAIIALFIVFALFAINPFAAAMAFLGFSSIYGMVTWITRKRLLQNGRRIALAQTSRLKALQEGLGGIRDVLLGGRQPTYCYLYRRADWEARKGERSNLAIDYSPRFVVEALGMTMIACLAYALGQKSGELSVVLPTLGALAMGAQRLLPAMQQTYTSWAIITGRQALLHEVLGLLDQPVPEELLLPEPKWFSFAEGISFEAVSFQYSTSAPLVIDGLTLNIPRGSRVGFVGSTGSGKSTLLDLLMGLLEPTSGRILIDGVLLSGERKRAWQRVIAHVPQSIFLADTTLAENIAFGVAMRDIDMDRVRQAARMAQIAEFIEGNPQGYYAMVGERGIRLSGGQRQRIGIARALYEEAEIMVFDEATSALDNTTELAVMKAIEALGRDLTVLMIAHRLSTIMHCDFIVELAEGRLVAQGSYDYLLANSPSFKKMAQTNEEFA